MFFSNPGNIQHYEIDNVSDASIEVKIFTDSPKGEHVYIISKDTRHPDLEVIKSEIRNGLQIVKNNGGDIEFHEYVERDYIFVKFPSGQEKQYTGRKIK